MLVRFVAYTIVVCLLVANVRGAEPRQNDDVAVKKVVNKVFKAMKKTDWKTYASLMHPDALSEIKKILVESIQSALEEGSEEVDEILLLFPDTKNIKTLAALTPSEFFARFVKGVCAKNPATKQILEGFSAHVIGIIYEKNGTAHAVVRSKKKLMNAEITQVKVISLKRHGNSWRMLMNGEFKGIALTIQQFLKKKSS